MRTHLFSGDKAGEPATSLLTIPPAAIGIASETDSPRRRTAPRAPPPGVPPPPAPRVSCIKASIEEQLKRRPVGLRGWRLPQSACSRGPHAHRPKPAVTLDRGGGPLFSRPETLGRAAPLRPLSTAVAQQTAEAATKWTRPPCHRQPHMTKEHTSMHASANPDAADRLDAGMPRDAHPTHINRRARSLLGAVGSAHAVAGAERHRPRGVRVQQTG